MISSPKSCILNSNIAKARPSFRNAYASTMSNVDFFTVDKCYSILYFSNLLDTTLLCFALLQLYYNDIVELYNVLFHIYHIHQLHGCASMWFSNIFMTVVSCSFWLNHANCFYLAIHYMLSYKAASFLKFIEQSNNYALDSSSFVFVVVLKPINIPISLRNNPLDIWSIIWSD